PVSYRLDVGHGRIFVSAINIGCWLRHGVGVLIGTDVSADALQQVAERTQPTRTGTRGRIRPLSSTDRAWFAVRNRAIRKAIVFGPSPSGIGLDHRGTFFLGFPCFNVRHWPR